MRGYHRRSAAAYLVAVAACFLLVTQLGGTLLQQSERPWWGILVGPDGTVGRVFADSPAAHAAIQKGDDILSFAGASWSRVWERQYEENGAALVSVRSEGGEVRQLVLPRDPVPTSEIVRLLIFGAIVLSFLLIGLVVFLSRSDRVSTLFFLMCLLFSRIIVPEMEARSPGTYLTNKIALDIAIMFLPAVFLHFFLYFPQRSRLIARHANRAWLLYLPALLSMPLVARLDVDLVFGDRAVGPAAMAFQSVMALLFVGMITAGVASFLVGVRNLSSPLLRRSLKWVLPGTALGILPPLLVLVILRIDPSLEIPGDRYVVGTFVLVPLSFAHAIFRYGLMDLELVVKRSVVYTALTALLVAVYYLVAEVLGTWVMERTGTGQTILSFVVVFAAALLFVPARDRIQRFVDRTFYRGRYSYRKTLRQFSSAFAKFMERDELVRLLIDRVPEVLGVERAVLFIRSNVDESLHIAATRGIGQTEVPLPTFHPSVAFQAWWREVGGPIPVEPGRYTERFNRLPADEQECLGAIDPSVIVFLPRERQIEGLLLLGPKKSGASYRGEDLTLLATLGDQAGTSLSSSRLHEEALERRRLEEELAVARRIQATLLPSEVPQPDGVEIAALTRPCQQVGGDFYDFLDFGARGLGLAVADVSGKGVPAALILSGLQATLRAEAGPEARPEPVVRKINERLCADVQPGSFASLLYGHLDLNTRAFRYVNAGHPAGLIVRRDGSLERLEEGGILLGIEPEAAYQSGSSTFESGDLLLLYSDGVTDVLNDQDEEYGATRLETLLAGVSHLPGTAVLDTIISSVESFVGGALPDDLTLLVAKFQPESGAQESPG